MRNRIELRNGVQVDLWLNVSALGCISKRISLSEIEELFKGDGNIAEKTEITAHLIECLANGAIQKTNADIKAGLEQGQERNLFPTGYFADNYTAGEIIQFIPAVMQAISEGINFKVPESIKLPPIDYEMQEVEKAKKKRTAKKMTTETSTS